ncbi:MAG TPA: hypothetical protein VIM70_19570 [Clostridium sp.]|uniref:hypothetical protein n=1 Tax=Clostridium sp. TaxID=1506 RepID=UPI002F9474DF
MGNDLKKIIHEEINEPLIKIVDNSSKKPKKIDSKLVVLLIIVSFLAVFLLYYAYKMLNIYF